MFETEQCFYRFFSCSNPTYYIENFFWRTFALLSYANMLTYQIIDKYWKDMRICVGLYSCFNIKMGELSCEAYDGGRVSYVSFLVLYSAC